MAQHYKIHFDISERKILLRFFDVFSVLIALFIINVFFDFYYFNFDFQHIYWIAVLAFYINVLGTVFEMYNLQVASNQFQIIKSIVLTTSTTVLFYILTPFFTPVLPSNRLQILYFFIAVFFALLFWRIFYQKFIASYRFEKNVILICDREQVQELVDGLKNIDPHFKIMGYVNADIEGNEGFKYDYIKNLELEELANFVTQNHISEILIATQKAGGITKPIFSELMRFLQKGFVIREYTHVYELMTQRIPIQHFDKDFYRYFPFNRNNHNKLYLIIVRALEFFISVFGLAFGCLLLPFILVGNAFGNQGKLFYKQTRIGKNGKNFQIFKLRTMVQNAEQKGAVFAIPNDERITKFGNFLRKSRIDEIPQFINILKNDMALIGPRPERPVFVEELAEVMPFYNIRHVIKPGITGWAQVNYAYGESISDSLVKLQYDLYYIKHRSVFLDISTLIKTFNTMLFYRGQ